MHLLAVTFLELFFSFLIRFKYIIIDCRIRDCRIIHREGRTVSVPPGYFGAASRNDGYFGTIKKMLYEDTIARVHWQENGTTSVVDIDIL